MASTPSSLLSQVPKLNGTNYADWKFAVTMVLRRAGCWAIANGTTAKPQRGDTTSWEALDDDALTLIGLSVEASQYQYIQDAETSAAAWTALKKHYEKNSRANRISLKRQFYGYKHNPEKPIQVYINDIRGLARRLAAIGVKVEDTDVMDVLIMNLDQSWSNIAGTLSQTLDDLASIEDVTGALTDEEGRRGSSENGGTAAITMQARQPLCWKCGKPGHKQYKCPERESSSPNAQKQEERANVAYALDIAY